jgi:hypothetical protein
MVCSKLVFKNCPFLENQNVMLRNIYKLIYNQSKPKWLEQRKTCEESIKTMKKKKTLTLKTPNEKKTKKQ